MLMWEVAGIGIVVGVIGGIGGWMGAMVAKTTKTQIQLDMLSEWLTRHETQDATLHRATMEHQQRLEAKFDQLMLNVMRYLAGSRHESC